MLAAGLPAYPAVPSQQQQRQQQLPHAMHSDRLQQPILPPSAYSVSAPSSWLPQQQQPPAAYKKRRTLASAPSASPQWVSSAGTASPCPFPPCDIQTTTTTTTPSAAAPATTAPLLAHVSGVTSVLVPAVSAPPSQVFVPLHSSHKLLPSLHTASLLEQQTLRMPCLSFLSIQKASAERFRKDAVEWLINVNAQYKHFRYHTETLFLAVNYMDRFLSVEKLDRSPRYFLLAMTALALACKIAEEFNDPLMEDMLMHLQPWHFTSKQIRKFERRLLQALNYELRVVTPVEVLYGFLSTTTMKSLLPLVASSSVHTQALQRRHSLPDLARFGNSPSSTPSEGSLPATQCVNPLCTCSSCAAASLSSSLSNEHWTQCCGQAPTVVTPVVRIAENYLIRSLPHYEFSAYPPSVLAMAAFNVALECVTTAISLQAQSQQQQQHLHMRSQQLSSLQACAYDTRYQRTMESDTLLSTLGAETLLKQAAAPSTSNPQLPSPLPSPIYNTFPTLPPPLPSSVSMSATASAYCTSFSSLPSPLGLAPAAPQPMPHFPKSLSLGFAPSAHAVPMESRQLSMCMSRFMHLLTLDQALMILRQSQSA
ncbi:hypothetical protein RI367_008038 [Sorochytrium milnesiophthora]